MERKDLLDELKRCAKDPVYFINKYVKIIHGTRGEIPFYLYNFQKELIHSYQRNRNSIILKSRQIGISWSTAAYVAWLMLFRKNKEIVVLSIKEETSKDFIKKIKQCIRSVPGFLKIWGIDDDNVKSISLTNGSTANATSSSIQAIRSKALSLLIVDEAAFVPNFDDIWKSAMPTLSTGGNCIMISTPNGAQGQFHKIWVGAENGENDFVPVLLPWQVHPERDAGWLEREKKSQGMSDREAAQEFECSFLKSGDTVVAPDLLDAIRKRCPTYENVEGMPKEFWVFHRPIQDIVYWLYADVARGDGEDYSAFHVMVEDIKAGKLVQCAEYKAKIPTDLYGNIIIDVAKMYNNAIVVVESNSIGWATLQQIKNSGYTRFFCQKKRESIQDLKSNQFGYLDFNIAASRGDYRLGINMNEKIKQLIPNLLEKHIRNNTIEINSIRFASELSTYVWRDNTRAEATRGYNDDLVTSMGIGLYMSDTINQSLLMHADLNNYMISSITNESKKFNNVKLGDKNSGNFYDKDMISSTNMFGARRYQTVKGNPMLEWLLK